MRAERVCNILTLPRKSSKDKVFALLHQIPDPGGKATSHWRGGWMIAQRNPVLCTQAPLCTPLLLSSQLVLEIEVLIPQTCENLLPTGLLGRRHGWFRGVPVPPIPCLCPLHDHWRCPTKAEGGHWIGGGVVATSLLTFMVSSSNLKPIFRSFHISISGLVCQRKHRSSL